MRIEHWSATAPSWERRLLAWESRLSNTNNNILLAELTLKYIKLTGYHYDK